jgi:hypothetical protein
MNSKKLDSMKRIESKISNIYYFLIIETFEDFKNMILEDYYMISEKLGRRVTSQDPNIIITILIFIRLNQWGFRITKSQLLKASQRSNADINDKLVHDIEQIILAE